MEKLERVERVDTLHFKDLTVVQKTLCCSIINKFGDGQHPVATVENLDGFEIEYLKELLAKRKFITAKKNLTALGKKILKELQAKL